MAGRGPAPKPTKLKVLAGNPGHEKLNRTEPKPRPVAPKCPTWLDLEAKREWRRVAPELERLGLLTVVDMAALAGYCQSYSTWRTASRALAEHGLTYEAANGNIRQRPEATIANKALAEVRQFCQEFGLTPSARSRMSLPEGFGAADDGDDDPFNV
ncbi:MAG: phage terminase small subunit P27 family [Chloroflexi bacterium]|nr:phage terminase small subunit P27 family [Chloroflexota bacterium]